MTEATIAFPPAERVVYDTNPIDEVVCQIRFPQILRITSEPPASFQELIRDQFPQYDEELNTLATAGLPPPLLEMLSGSNAPKRHRFSTRDRNLIVLLDGQNLTFTTSNYRRWDDFSPLVYSTIEAFISEYKPSFISRVGLRYQNLIATSGPSAPLPLTEALRRELLGVLVNDAWLQQTSEFASALRCRLGEGEDRLLLQSGLELHETRGRLFKLDFDYYVEEETEPQDATGIIDRLHGYSGPAFRWAILPALHEVLGPRPVGHA